MLQKSKSFAQDTTAFKGDDGNDDSGDVSQVRANLTRPVLRKAKTFDYTGEIDAELAATLRARRGSSEESDDVAAK